MRQPQRKRKSGLIILILLFAVGAIIAASIVVPKFTSPIKSVVKLPFGIYYNYAFTGNGFVYIEGSSLNYYSLSDSKQNYSVMLENTDVKLAGSDSVQVVYTNTSVRIPKNQVSLDLSGTVLSVKCYHGFVAVHIEENSGASPEKPEKILVYNAAGEQLDEILFDGRKLIGYGFFRNTKYDQLYTIELDYKASMPITLISTYSLTTSAKTGIITIQNQLVERMIFTEKSVFAVGTNDIIRYEAEGHYESYRLLCYGYSYVDSAYSKSSAVFLMKDADDEGSIPKSVRIYKAAQGSMPDDKLQLLSIPETAKGVFAIYDRVYVLTANRLNRYSTQGGEDGSYKLSIAVDGATKLSDNKLLISSGAELYLITLKP
ncbi:MAG TPA: hypothetical protein GXZ61_00590 [Clostridiales bacterium]|nr:hypothetical protein [Clostridiales bacterium]